MGRPALRLLPSVREPLAELVPVGRLVELSAPTHGPGARTTTAVSILAHVQRQGETAVWLQPVGGPLYPPDLAEAGIDLEALVVVHVPASAGPHGSCKAAELLLRSGAFGLIVLDLCAGVPPGSGEAWQGRLLGLARQHHARVVLLTDKPSHASSLGPLVGVRIESGRERATTSELATIVPARPSSPDLGLPNVDTPGFDMPDLGTRPRHRRGKRPGRFTIEHTVLKNKTGQTLDPATDLARGPWGL